MQHHVSIYLFLPLSFQTVTFITKSLARLLARTSTFFSSSLSTRNTKKKTKKKARSNVLSAKKAQGREGKSLQRVCLFESISQGIYATDRPFFSRVEKEDGRYVYIGIYGITDLLKLREKPPKRGPNALAVR